ALDSLKFEVTGEHASALLAEAKFLQTLKLHYFASKETMRLLDLMDKSDELPNEFHDYVENSQAFVDQSLELWGQAVGVQSTLALVLRERLNLPPPVQTLVPTASIVAISPNPGRQGIDTITFTGSGDDPDDIGTAPKIRGYRWTSDIGTTDGRVQLYPPGNDTFLPNASFQIAASQLKVGTHHIRLQVKDNDGEVSDFAEATLEIRAGSSTANVTIHSPTTASPVSLLPGGYFSADVEWNLEGMPGFNADAGVVVSVGYETSSGSFRTTETGPYHEAHRRVPFSSLSTSPGSYRGLRDVLVKIIQVGTRPILAEAVMPDALNFTSQQPQNMTLGISPNSITINPSASGQFTVTVNGQNGFDQPVNLAVVGGLTEGISANFSPNPVSPGRSSTLTLNASSSSPPGTYFVAVQGTGGGITAAASGKYIIPGPNLVLEFRNASQVTGTRVAQIDCTLTGSKPNYYHMGWEYLKPGSSTWTPINASSISGPNPVSPGQFSLTWDTSAATDLNGFDGNVLFRMRIASNPNGQLDLLQTVSLPVAEVWGITWTGSRFLITSGDGTGRRQIHELNTSFSITGGPWSLPFGSHNWAAAWNSSESRLYVIDGNGFDRVYKLKADFTADTLYEGPSAYGALWANLSGYAIPALWLVDGPTLRVGFVGCPLNRCRFQEPYPGSGSLSLGNFISSMSGVTYDGEWMYACSDNDSKLLQFKASEQSAYVKEVFSTAAIAEGTFRDIVFGNGALWLVGRFGDKVYRIGVPEKFASGGVGISLDNNSVPAAPQISGPSGTVSNDVQIAYQLGDTEGDTLSIMVEYSVDSGMNWISAAISGSASEIPAASYNGSCLWRSTANLPNFEGPARLRMRADDRDPGLVSNEIIVNLRNRSPAPPHNPDTPANLYPFASQVNAPTNAILIASAFLDPDPDSLFSRSRFQVIAAGGIFASPLWDSGELNPPTSSAQVLDGVLQPNTKYLWRVCYRDDSGLWSAWSADTAFTTGSPPGTTVSITSPTSNPTYSTSSSAVDLGGTTSGSTIVTNVTWTNDRGGSGVAVGTSSWSISGISLQDGTNVIIISARDAAGQQGVDTITVIRNQQSIVRWTELPQPVKPSVRSDFGFVWDTLRNEGVLFGGGRHDPPWRQLGDTWIFKNGTWSQKSPANSPSARRTHAMAFDSNRGRTVLYGGELVESGGSGSHETWEWDGSNWLQQNPSSTPLATDGPRMAYDAVRKVCVLFGGYTAPGGTQRTETWTWDGLNWVQKFPSVSPTVSLGHDMAYDPLRQRVVFFSDTDLTWEWDGSTWQQRTSATHPAGRWLDRMAYLESLGGVVLFVSSADGNLLNSCWWWDGNDWHQLAPAQSPRGRAGSGIVEDRLNGRLILFGGIVSSTVFLNDTWSLARAVIITNPRLSGNTLTLSVPTEAGITYILEFKNLLSDATWTAVQNVSGNGGQMTLSDTSASSQTRFYRIRVE
ncbi:MAG: hypothetical protein HY674_21860, partial [Chloroflexi bacterium]|nr:hypothetical protein [Chloroflexota bacterium]